MATTIIDTATGQIMNQTEQLYRLIKAVLEGPMGIQNLINVYEKHQGTRELGRALAKITINGAMPEILSYSDKDIKLYEYLVKRTQEYNQTKEGAKNPINIIASSDGENRKMILTDKEGLLKLKEFRLEYTIENNIGPYSREIATDEFIAHSKDKSITILNNLTEEQYDYITRKSWGEKNKFVYTTTINEDGTYNIAVLSKNYMNNSRNGSRDDVFATLVTEKVASVRGGLESVKYERDLENKIAQYDGYLKDKNGEYILDKNNNKIKIAPLYIAPARDAGIFLKVEKDTVSVFNENGLIETLKKPYGDFKNMSEDDQYRFVTYFSEIERYYQAIKEPVEIDEKIMNKINMQGRDVESYLMEHAYTGNDTDLMVSENGISAYTRPIENNTNEREKKFTKGMSAEIENRVLIVLKKEIISDYSALLRKNLQNSGLNQKDVNELCQEFENRILSYVDYGDNRKTYEKKALETIDEVIDFNAANNEMISRLTEDERKKLLGKCKEKILTLESEPMKQFTDERLKKELDVAFCEVKKEIQIKDYSGLAKDFAITIQKNEGRWGQLMNNIESAIHDVAVIKAETIYAKEGDDYAHYLTDKLIGTGQSDLNKTENLKIDLMDKARNRAFDDSMRLNRETYMDFLERDSR